MPKLTTIKRVAIATTLDDDARERLRLLVLREFPNAHVWIGSPLGDRSEGYTVKGTFEAHEWDALKRVAKILKRAAEPEPALDWAANRFARMRAEQEAARG